jgi:hypothetical protein
MSQYYRSSPGMQHVPQIDCKIIPKWEGLYICWLYYMNYCWCNVNL